MKRRSIKLIMLICGFASTVYATDNSIAITAISDGNASTNDVIMTKTGAVISGNKTIVASNVNVVSACTVEGTPITVKCLDNIWQARENLTSKNQTDIANYLLTQPTIPGDYAAAWKIARLVYFIGNYGVGEQRFTKTDEGVTLFDYGVKAGKIAMGIDSSKVEGLYWYAVDLGSWGLAKGIIAAASSAGDGMDALKSAKKIDPSYQWYGSSRILGRYYQELPGIFGGSDKKALELYKEVVAKSPNNGANLLYLGRYYLKDGDYSQALDWCKKGLALPSVEGKFEDLRYRRELNSCISNANAKLKN